MKKTSFPHTYVIFFSIIVLSAVLTWILPGEEYTSHPGAGTVKIMQAPEFRQIDNVPKTWQVFAAMYKGFVRHGGIIVFILMIGGACWIMNETRPIDSGIISFQRFSKKIEKLRLMRALGVQNIILTLIMLLFSLFGVVFGMSKETIAFVSILVPGLHRG